MNIPETLINHQRFTVTTKLPSFIRLQSGWMMFYTFCLSDSVGHFFGNGRHPSPLGFNTGPGPELLFHSIEVPSYLNDLLIQRVRFSSMDHHSRTLNLIFIHHLRVPLDHGCLSSFGRPIWLEGRRTNFWYIYKVGSVPETFFFTTRGVLDKDRG